MHQPSPRPRPTKRRRPRKVGPYQRTTVWLVVALVVLVMALWLWGTPPGVNGKLEAIGYAVCHRIPERSFQVNGHPLPLCVRCSGIYLGALSSMGIFLVSGRHRTSGLPPKRALVILALFVITLGLDGLNSYLHLFPGYSGPYEPQNWLRLVTGSLTGLAMMGLLFPVYNATVWRYSDPRPILRSTGELLSILVVIGLLDLLVLLQHPIVLLVLGLLTGPGPAIVLTMVWSVLFLTFTRRENYAHSWRDLIVPTLAALALTFMMLGAIDAARFWLTGTWDGFDFSHLATNP